MLEGRTPVGNLEQQGPQPRDACTTNPSNAARYNAIVFDRVDPAEAQRRVQTGAALVDVREADEYAQARVPGAKLIPLSEFAARVGELPADREVVLMCAGGVRSARAAEFAAGQGLRVTNLEGGINAWNSAGLPVEFGGTA